MKRSTTKVVFPLTVTKRTNGKISSLSKYNGHDLIIVADNEGIVRLEHYDSNENVLISVKDLPKLIDSLMYVHNMETRYKDKE